MTERNINVLGIETSCDETAAAVISSNKEILSNIVYSQFEDHNPYKGVVPEIASRAHIKHLDTIVINAIQESGLSLNDIDCIAATGGPGLIGGVIVGTVFAKSIASVLKKPFIAVNHLAAHALTIRLTNSINYPYLLLLASGGHCQYVAVLDFDKFVILGQTFDDAVGEAFDKTAKLLGLDYPGGPIIEQRALNGDSSRFKLPIAMSDRPGCDMSFSGLKTATRLLVDKNKMHINEQFINDICASFQYTIALILQNRSKNAINEFRKLASSNNFVIAGGVAANRYIYNSLSNSLAQEGFNVLTPPINLCTDNATMVAWAGYENYISGKVDGLDFCPRARWPLSEL